MNRAKLKGAIAENGLSMRELAKELNVSEKAFYNKMKRGVFGTDEAEAMVAILKISDSVSVFLVSE